jgi:hypothetical protein
MFDSRKLGCLVHRYDFGLLYSHAFRQISRGKVGCLIHASGMFGSRFAYFMGSLVHRLSRKWDVWFTGNSKIGCLIHRSQVV